MGHTLLNFKICLVIHHYNHKTLIYRIPRRKKNFFFQGIPILKIGHVGNPPLVYFYPTGTYLMDLYKKNKNKKTSRDLLWCGLSNVENGANSFTAKKNFFWAFFRSTEILLKIEARIIQYCLVFIMPTVHPFLRL